MTVEAAYSLILDDVAIAAAAVGGQAWTEAHSALRRKVIGAARSAGLSAEDAKDVFQELYLELQSTGRGAALVAKATAAEWTHEQLRNAALALPLREAIRRATRKVQREVSLDGLAERAEVPRDELAEVLEPCVPVGTGPDVRRWTNVSIPSLIAEYELDHRGSMSVRASGGRRQRLVRWTEDAPTAYEHTTTARFFGRAWARPNGRTALRQEGELQGLRPSTT